MATVGTQLLQPEEGWKRYDNSTSNFIYSDNMEFVGDNNFYNSTLATDTSSNKSATAKFYFKSDKLRIISYTHSSVGYSFTSDMNISIDGTNYSANLYRTQTFKCLVFEITGLEDCIHEVILSSNDKTRARGISLDAIDLDESGYMVNPYLTQNNNIKNLNIGERISFNYTYANGFNSFYEGDLNFICVESSLKKNILISDSVIPNISFDEINQKGFIYGNEIPHSFGDNFNISVRSMTNTEYDKYIVNSDLGGLITAGDKNIWSWDIASITSSTPTDSSKITTIGGASVSTITQALVQTSKAATYGFRPILIIDELRVPPILISSTKFGLHGDNLNLSITDISINRGDVQEDEIFYIFIKDNIGDIIYTENLNANINSFNYVIQKDSLNILNNNFGNITIEIVDMQELSHSVKINLAIINSNIYVYDTCYVSSNIHNTNQKDNAIINLDVTGNNLLFICIDNVNYTNINNLEKININKNNIKIISMLDKEAKLNSLGIAFVN